jgi:hypothetical protein
MTIIRDLKYFFLCCFIFDRMIRVFLIIEPLLNKKRKQERINIKMQKDVLVPSMHDCIHLQCV